VLIEPCVVEHTCNPSTPKVEAGELRVPGQPGIHNVTLCPKKKKKKTGLAEWLMG
jgi:hypothetical protein